MSTEQMTPLGSTLFNLAMAWVDKEIPEGFLEYMNGDVKVSVPRARIASLLKGMIKRADGFRNPITFCFMGDGCSRKTGALFGRSLYGAKLTAQLFGMRRKTGTKIPVVTAENGAVSFSDLEANFTGGKAIHIYDDRSAMPEMVTLDEIN